MSRLCEFPRQVSYSGTQYVQYSHSERPGALHAEQLERLGNRMGFLFSSRRESPLLNGVCSVCHAAAVGCYGMLIWNPSFSNTLLHYYDCLGKKDMIQFSISIRKCVVWIADIIIVHRLAG